jgi:hypothetical protein
MTRQAWFSKNAVVTLERDGGAAVSSVTGDITSFDEGGGDKNTEYINVFGGGQIAREERQEPFEVTFEVIPTDLTWYEPLYGAKTTESSVEVVKSTEIDFVDYRITITWADGFDSGTPKEPNSGEAKRLTYVDAKAATMTPSESADEELTASVSFNVAATDTDGNALKYVEYTDNAATKAFDDPYGKAGVRQAYGSYD